MQNCAQNKFKLLFCDKYSKEMAKYLPIEIYCYGT